MSCRDDGLKRIVVLPAVADGVGLLPGAGVRIECVAEVLMAHVGDRVRPLGGAEEAEAQDVADCVVTEFGIVDKREAVLVVAEVGPELGGNFELRFFPAVGAFGGALDFAVSDVVGGVVALCAKRERGLEENVGFVPVDLIVDIDLTIGGSEADGLDELGVLPGAGYADGRV